MKLPVINDVNLEYKITLSSAVSSFPTCKHRVWSSGFRSLLNITMESSSTYLFGKRFRNRLFVGGLPVNTTAHELANYFSNFGHVIETKIIFDENNVPKGYGFVTFASEKDVHNVTEMGTLFFRNKKLNLGPAVKKQGPMPLETPELVVVNTQMKGDFFYPVPYSTYSPERHLPQTPQYPYQYPCQVSYAQQPAGHYMYVYEEQPPLIYYQTQPTSMPTNVQHCPQVACPPQKMNKRLPPRMRRSREI